MEHNSQPIKLQHTLKVKNINVKVIISLVYFIVSRTEQQKAI